MDTQTHKQKQVDQLALQIMDNTLRAAFIRWKQNKVNEDSKLSADVKTKTIEQYQLKLDQTEAELEALREYQSFLEAYEY
ncbi:MAG: hypothetical protein VW270_06880 [Candidatus Poseidoniales archaeon]|jgi:hypothetical protein